MQLRARWQKESNYPDVKYFSYFTRPMEIRVSTPLCSSKRTGVLPRPKRSKEEGPADARLDRIAELNVWNGKV
jgi:hypothetical protein